MSPSSPNKLNLTGALQVDTAIAALAATGINPSAHRTLETFRGIQKQLVIDFPDALERIILSFGEDDKENDKVRAMKADILVSLELLSTQADTPEQKIAAQALLEVMQSE